MTIDSNVVLGAFERARRAHPTPKDRACRALIEMHPGEVQLSVSARTIELEATGWRKELERRGILRLPSIARVDLSFPGNDVYPAGDEHVDAVKRLERILHPGTLPRDWKNLACDVDVIHHHVMWGGDFLVTCDGLMLSAGDALGSSFGVRLLGPEEAIEVTRAAD